MTNESEKLTSGPEQRVETTSEAGLARAEQLAQNQERIGEQPLESAERKTERARVEALETAVSVEASGAEVHRQTEPPLAVKRRGPISKRERDIAFKYTMTEVQAGMKPASRAFSKLIHTKPVEKSSEIVGATIARPNAILSGAIAAFIVTFGVYLVAKNFGYPLSGFESIGAFIIGWALGIVFDYMRIMITGKK